MWGKIFGGTILVTFKWQNSDWQPGVARFRAEVFAGNTCKFTNLKPR